MRHTLYEDPTTHKFALVKMPAKFIEGDKLLIPPTVHWFTTREGAVAALSSLFELDDDNSEEY